ncbi:MAG TPA: type II toxin-antitoxin system VapC family toxin [Blastocatellia bacterium]
MFGYAVGLHGKLSEDVRSIFDLAWRHNQAVIYVPCVALWEISLLVRSGKIKLRDSFDTWSRNLLRSSCFDLAPLSGEAIRLAHGLPFDDPFDGAIVATAKSMNLPLITKDLKITNSGAVDVMW